MRRTQIKSCVSIIGRRVSEHCGSIKSRVASGQICMTLVRLTRITQCLNKWGQRVRNDTVLVWVEPDCPEWRPLSDWGQFQINSTNIRNCPGSVWDDRNTRFYMTSCLSRLPGLSNRLNWIILSCLILSGYLETAPVLSAVKSTLKWRHLINPANCSYLAESRWTAWYL